VATLDTFIPEESLPTTAPS